MRSAYRFWIQWVAFILVSTWILLACSTTTTTPLAVNPIESDSQPLVQEVGTSLTTSEVVTSQLDSPHGVILAPDGSLLIAELDSGQIVNISQNGSVRTTYASGLDHPTGLIRTPDGILWVVSQNRGLFKVSLQGEVSPVTTSTPIDGAYGITTRQTEPGRIQLLIVESGQGVLGRSRLLAVDPNSGNVTVLSQNLGNPRGIEVRANGHILVSEVGPLLRYGRILEFDAAGNKLADLVPRREDERFTGLLENQAGEVLAVTIRVLGNEARIVRVEADGSLTEMLALNFGDSYGFVESGQNSYYLTEKRGQVVWVFLGSEDPVTPEVLEIVNAEEVDGKALTVGESIEVIARAQDTSGRDLSSTVEWLNDAGEVLYRGKTLTYQAKTVKMETLTARLGSNSQKVSFTVSSPEIVLADRVKRLPDDPNTVVLLDWENQVLQFREQANFPLIRVGDVVVGAAMQVPPVRVTELSRDGDILSLTVTVAYPKEVIKSSPVLDDWILVPSKFSSETSAVSLLSSAVDCDFPIEPFEQHFTFSKLTFDDIVINILDTLRWPFFKQARARLSPSIELGGNLRLNSACLEVNPLLEIQEEGKLFNGIKRFGVEVGLTKINWAMDLEAKGKAKISADFVSETIPLPETPTIPLWPGLILVLNGVPYPVSPIPIWIVVEPALHFEALPNLEIEGSLKAGAEITDGFAVWQLSYSEDSGEPNWESPVLRENLTDPGSWRPIFTTDSKFFSGRLELAVVPQFEGVLWGGGSLPLFL